MGIQVQPCCCNKWLALSFHGWLYDIDIHTGQLSNARNLAIPPVDGAQGGFSGGMVRHSNGRLYAFTHALAVDKTSYLYELPEDGSPAIQIGQLQGPTAVVSGVLNGISSESIACNSAGQIYGFCFRGQSDTNRTLMAIDVLTGTQTRFPADYDGHAEPPPSVVSSGIFGSRFRQADGLLWVHGKAASGSTATVRLGIMDTVSGLVTWGSFTALTYASPSKFPTAMVFDGAAETTFYTVGFLGSASAVYQCTNATGASPTMLKHADISGKAAADPQGWIYGLEKKR